MTVEVERSDLYRLQQIAEIAVKIANCADLLWGHIVVDYDHLEELKVRLQKARLLP